jgi:hypothetical protein
LYLSMFIYSRYLCGGTFTPNYICLIITYVLLLGGYNNAKMPFQNRNRNNVSVQNVNKEVILKLFFNYVYIAFFHIMTLNLT